MQQSLRLNPVAHWRYACLKYSPVRPGTIDTHCDTVPKALRSPTNNDSSRYEIAWEGDGAHEQQSDVLSLRFQAPYSQKMARWWLVCKGYHSEVFDPDGIDCVHLNEMLEMEKSIMHPPEIFYLGA